MPDSAFATGRSATAPMQSQDSGLPLRDNAAPPAGSGPSKTSLAGDGIWSFDDEEVQMPTGGGRAFDGSAAFPGTPVSTEKASKSKNKATGRKWRWRWPWQKEKELVGERIIALNNSPMNADYCSNFVSTSKYNMASFVPKFLGGAFRVFYLLHEANWGGQNNSLNTPIYSSCLRRVFNKYRTCRLRISIRQLPRWLSYYSLPHSKKSKKI